MGGLDMIEVLNTSVHQYPWVGEDGVPRVSTKGYMTCQNNTGWMDVMWGVY